MKAKWAFYLGVADPDYIKRADENRQTRYRIVEEELIRVWLQKRHGKRETFSHLHRPSDHHTGKGKVMAPDRQVAAAYRQLRPYCDSLPDGQVQSLDDGFNAGEPYYSLSWLIADILENNIAVPQDVLLDAYALLDDEDKEEYASLIEKRSDTP